MPAPIPQIIRDLIVQSRKEGKSESQIASDTGYSQATISRILRNPAPVFQVSSWDRLGAEVQSEVRGLHLKGYSQTYLSQKYGIAMKPLAAALTQPEFHGKTGLARLECVAEHVIREYQETAIGMRELARRFGVQERTLKSFLQARNLVKTSGAQPDEHNHQYKGRSNEIKKQRDRVKYWARQVAHSVLGQKLPGGFVIHHMNENPGDQTVTNLWIFPSSSDHLTYHQRQLLNLRQGALLAPSQVARDNGGLWLPEISARLQAQPDTELHTLFCKREMQELAQQEF